MRPAAINAAGLFNAASTRENDEFVLPLSRCGVFLILMEAFSHAALNAAGFDNLPTSERAAMQQRRRSKWKSPASD